ncbi:hypothetical protein CG28_003977 [Salmonella enterica subsp. enterica serovar Ohio]|nr:hypothetical protein [Salmonella enterica subsp. enterica]EAW1178866.1 hypothetical protein [Salmonella enterica subsp. enterica]EBT7001873.1 hypothetical protein [Salmonella enterica]EDV8896616.1 hypothetical protein [Salmonella enterica subsp. enterica serovar Ohio]EHG6389549.1 hypothetical protein [Salmonella enterica subsp. enterica serovar Thompson]
MDFHLQRDFFHHQILCCESALWGLLKAEPKFISSHEPTKITKSQPISCIYFAIYRLTVIVSAPMKQEAHKKLKDPRLPPHQGAFFGIMASSRIPSYQALTARSIPSSPQANSHQLM